MDPEGSDRNHHFKFKYCLVRELVRHHFYQMASSTPIYSSLPPCRGLEHHVFLCHGYGDPWCDEFVNQLHYSLSVAGVDTFNDDEASSNISCRDYRFQVVEESTMSLVVLSPVYASSRWCLDVILKIISCWAETGRVVVPILSGVDRYQIGRELISFLEKENTMHPVKHHSKTIAQWRGILMKAMDLPGWDITGWDIDTAVEMIVRDVLKKIASSQPSSSSRFPKLMNVENFKKPPGAIISRGEMAGQENNATEQLYAIRRNQPIDPNMELSHPITLHINGWVSQLSGKNLERMITLKIQKGPLQVGTSANQEQEMINSFIIHEPIEETGTTNTDPSGSPEIAQHHGAERLSVSSTDTQLIVSSSKTSLESPEIVHLKETEMGKLHAGEFTILFSIMAPNIQNLKQRRISQFHNAENLTKHNPLQVFQSKPAHSKRKDVSLSVKYSKPATNLEVQCPLAGLVVACIGASLNLGVTLYKALKRTVDFHNCFELAAALSQLGTSSVGFWYSQNHLPSPIKANMTMLLFVSLLLVYKFFQYSRLRSVKSF